MAVQDLARIEERIDRTAAGAIVVSDAMGGLMFQNMMELMEFAKLVSVSGAAVPSHLRGNPGACLAICVQALEWKMSPFAVANKSYLVNNKGEERIAYESQLVHAVIEARAPIQGRLRYEITGEGDDRRCKVWGLFRNEKEPHVYVSEPLGKLRDARGRNDYGKIKGSPLWDSQPEVQLFYSASRQWCRIYAPDTLLGIYTNEELDEPIGPDRAKDVTPEKPTVGERLKAKGSRGFSEDHVSREIGHEAAKTGEVATVSQPAGDSQPANTGGADEVATNTPRSDTQTAAAPDVAKAGGKPATESDTGEQREASDLTSAQARKGDEPEASDEGSRERDPGPAAASSQDGRPAQESQDGAQGAEPSPARTHPAGGKGEGAAKAPDGPSPAFNLYAAFAEALQRATQAKSLKALKDQFWDRHEYPLDDTDAKDRLKQIYDKHAERITKGIKEGPAFKALQEDLRELCAP